MSQTNSKYKRLESLFSTPAPVPSDTDHIPTAQRVQTLKERIAELEAKIPGQLRTESTKSETAKSSIEPALPPSVIREGQQNAHLNMVNEAASNARRVTGIGLIAALIAASFYLYLGITTGAWQLYAWSLDIGLLAVATAISLVLIRRGRVEKGMWLTLGAIQVTFLAAVALIQGIGVVAGISMALLMFILAGQTLSGKAVGLANILGIAGGVAAIFLDFLELSYRLPQPEVIRIFLPGILGIVTVIYGLMALRKFSSYSLRTKFLLGILGIMVLLGSFTAYTINQQTQAVEKTAVLEASHVAETLGTIVSKNQADLQELVVEFHETQQRDVVVVDSNRMILADAIPENIGTTFDHDKGGELTATLNDGQARVFVETSPDYPEGIQQVTVPILDEENGSIIGAIILDYTGALKQSFLREAGSFAQEASVIFANDPAGLQNFVGVLSTARRRDMVVVDPQKVILADAVPLNVGTIFTRDMNGEVTATLQDGNPRTFVETGVDYPAGTQKVVMPIKAENGSVVGAAILGLSAETEETAVEQATRIAEVLAAAVSQNQARVQEFVDRLHEDQNRDVVLVNADKRILSDAIPENIGIRFEHDPNGEVSATLKDGQSRTFLETSPDYPNGINQVVVPVKDESGTITAAAILDYTALYEEIQQRANATARTLIGLGIGALLLAFLISNLISSSITTPLTQLSGAATKIGNGQLDTPILMPHSQDEVGTLALAFKNMTDQLRSLVGSLEQRVAERTHDLELATEVGRAVSQKLADINGLLEDAVERIRDRFDLYYTQIYLVDQGGRNLVLRAGTGTVGQELLRRGHQLPIGSGSLNGRAAAEKRTIIVADTKNDPNFLPNPLLPNTHSEMVIPLVVDGKVVGVLDMQSEQSGALNETNLPAFDALAGQLAVAIQNAALFSQVQQSRAEVEAQMHGLTTRGWQDYLDGIERGQKIGYSFDQSQVVPLDESSLSLTPLDNSIIAPIQWSNTSIGSIQVSSHPGKSWADTDVEITNTVATSLAQHIENLRLLAQAEKYRTEAEQAVRRMARQGWDALQTRGDFASGYLFNLNDVKPLTEDLGSNAAIKQSLEVRSEDIGEIALVSDHVSEEAKEIVEAVARQLSDHIETLRLSQEIEKRAYELATVANVSTKASTLLDPDQLLQSVVDLTKERFGLYHAHVYLADESWQTLLLAAGAGEVGRQMVAERWNIPISHPTSIVADVARNRKSVIANELYHDKNSTYLSNRLLPDTRSEMAVPMVVGEKLLGVFDVQSNVEGRFTEEDANIYTTLAAQVGVALQNARLYVEQAATVTQLRELDRLKSAFLANMSHELRTPLNSILGFSDVILEELDGPITDLMQNDLQLIQKNGRHLLHLINDVLDMAKIDAGRMNLHPENFRLHELFEEVVAITSPLATDKSLSLNISSNSSDQYLEVFADRTRIQQVMINLVNNAIKFTEKGQVTIHAAQPQNGNVVISVRDTGLGIPVDHLETVFQEFTQVDTSTTRKVGGTGLGLPISRRLIQLHGGRLWAESTGISGEGSVLYIELPIQARIAEPIEKQER